MMSHFYIRLDLSCVRDLLILSQGLNLIITQVHYLLLHESYFRLIFSQLYVSRKELMVLQIVLNHLSCYFAIDKSTKISFRIDSGIQEMEHLQTILIML